MTEYEQVLTVGFTGSRLGMTDAQAKSIVEILMAIKPAVVVHGDCVGADADFDALVSEFKIAGVKCRIEIRPGTDRHGRSPYRAYTHNAATIHPPRSYLVRNEDIVKQSDALIACPGGTMPEQRSGTWSTVRKAVKHRVPVYIVMPGGGVSEA